MASRPRRRLPIGRCDTASHSLAAINPSRTTPMPNKHPRMKLSPEEEAFLRHWMYDEVHYADGPGPAKQLQLHHGVAPADLALLIAAGIPDPADQEAAGSGPPEGLLLFRHAFGGLEQGLRSARGLPKA